MPHKRVHELAKDLGVETKDLIARLEKLGIRNKRSQSSLTEEAVERVKAEFASEEKPSIAVGDERVVHGEGQTVVERRVRTNVIRRRTTRIEAPAVVESAGLSEPLPTHAETFESFESFITPELLPEPLPPSRPPPSPAPAARSPSRARAGGGSRATARARGHRAATCTPSAPGGRPGTRTRSATIVGGLTRTACARQDRPS